MTISSEKIETSRLRLRPLVASDSITLSEIGDDILVADTILSVPIPFPEHAAREWIEKGIANPDAVSMAVVEKQAGALVGTVNLMLEVDHEQAELGFWIGVTYWRRGYATEAARALLCHAFTDLALNRVHAHHMLRNPASSSVLRNIGMRSEGVLRQRIKKNGVFEDVALYGILREEFLSDQAENPGTP